MAYSKLGLRVGDKVILGKELGLDMADPAKNAKEFFFECQGGDLKNQFDMGIIYIYVYPYMDPNTV